MMFQNSIPRRIANWIVMRLLNSPGQTDRNWALAMASEVDAIENDWTAVRFALGCYQAMWLKGAHLVWMRTVLAFMIFGWAMAKIYLAWWMLQGGAQNGTGLGWMPIAAGCAGLAYATAGLSLLRNRLILAGGSLLAALCVNAVWYLSAITLSELSVWQIAIAGEDYFIWTASLTGFALLSWLSVPRGEAAE